MSVIVVFTWLQSLESERDFSKLHFFEILEQHYMNPEVSTFYVLPTYVGTMYTEYMSDY